MNLNNKGFTLIELLAAMVILAAIMAIAVPNIIGILNNSKADAYVEDAKKMISLAEYKVRANPNLRPVSTESCRIPLRELDNSEFKNAPNNGKYNLDNSFVVVTRSGSADKKIYTYSVTIVEDLGEGKGTRGISNASYTNLYQDKPTSLVNNSPSTSGPGKICGS